MSSVAGSSAAFETLRTASGAVGAVEQQERLVALAAEVDGRCRVDVERPPSDVDGGLRRPNAGARCGEDAVHGQRIVAG